MDRIFKLDNGLTVVSQPMDGMLSVALGFWVKVGSVCEWPAISGSSHFIEHMLFRGTAKRSSKEISKTIGRLGGYINAFTSREYTCYFARAHGDHLPVIVELISDMIQDSSFLPEHMDKERTVILDELSGCDDDPEERVYKTLLETIFKEHPLGKPILGTVEFINQATHNQLMNFMRDHYTVENIVISVAGHFNQSKLFSLLNESFGKGNFYSEGLNKNNQMIPKFHGGWAFEKQSREQTYICLAYEGVPLFDKDMYAFMVLDAIVGSGSVSRLFQAVREKEGLTYSIGSQTNIYEKIGLIEIDTSFHMAVFEQFVNVFVPVLEDLAQGNISDEEIFHAKSELKGGLVIHREGTEQTMMDNGQQQLFFKSVRSLEESLEEINQVSAEQVRRLAKEIFSCKKMALSVIGNLESQQVEKFYKRLCSIC